MPGSAPRPRSCARLSPSMATPRGATLRISALGLYRCFHQRQARRRRSADAGLDQLLGPPELPDLRRRRPAAGRREHHRHLARRRLVPLAHDVAAQPDPQHLGRARSAPSPSCAAPTATSCSPPTRRWQSGLAPILKSGIYFGESYRRARREPAPPTGGAAVIAGFDKSTLIPHETNGVQELPPIAGRSAALPMPTGGTVYDFGQNAGGYVAFTVEGEAGATRRRRACRSARPRGRVRPRQHALGRGARRVRAQGRRPESYRPTFTFFGFRYARVTITGEARITAIEMIPISSAITPDRGVHLGASAGQPAGRRTRSGRSAPTSSKCRPTVRSATSASAGPATRRSSPRPPATSHESQGILRKYVRDMMADQRPDGAVPHVVARSDAQSRGHRPRLLRLDRLGRCDLHHPAGALRALRRPRHRRRGAAGDGEVERLRLVDQRRPDRPPAAGVGRPRLHLRRLAAAAWAASGRAKSPSAPSATTPRRRSTSTSRPRSRPAPPRIVGDDGARSAHGRRAPKTVKAAFAREFITAVGPPGLRRPDLLRAGLPP